MTNSIYTKHYTFYILYETTCKVNNKTYVGCHATNKLDDGYLGSGKHLTRAIKKHGREMFVRKIIQFFDNPADMFNSEKLTVTDEYVKDNSTYNLVVGGSGGFKVQDVDEWKRKLKESSANRTTKTPMLGKNHSNETKLKMSVSNTGRAPWNVGLPGTWVGKHHSDESKQKISQNRIGLTAGKDNPMYGKSAVKGRKWFNNGTNTFYLFPGDTKILELALIHGRIPKQVS